MTLLPSLFVLLWTCVSKSLPKCHPAGGRGAIVSTTCLLMLMPAENKSGKPADRFRRSPSAAGTDNPPRAAF
jgi:hypothetical protein